MIKFEAGKTYFGRSIGDSEQITKITIAKRTASFVTTSEGKRLKVKPMYDGRCEYVNPDGVYSMCLMITAEREVK